MSNPTSKTNMLLGKRIFIVEDNSLNRVVYQVCLGMQGAQIDFAKWGRDAVFRLQQFRRVDLIILDLMLYNDISGFEVFNRIRQLPAYNSIPIVAVSAAEPALAIPKAKELGFSGFISKPIDEEQFPYQLLSLLEGKEIW